MNMTKQVFLFFILFCCTANTFAQSEKIDVENFDNKKLVEWVLKHTNTHRQKHWRKKLSENKKLHKAAQLHALQMKKYNFFSHLNRKNRRLYDIQDRIKAAHYKPYTFIAENIYYGYIHLENEMPTYSEVAQTIVEAFRTSVGHNKNLLHRKAKELGGYFIFDTTKDGFLHYYYVQNFGARYR